MRTTVDIQPDYETSVRHFTEDDGRPWSTLIFAGSDQRANLYVYSVAEVDDMLLKLALIKDHLLAVPLAPCPDPAQHEPHDRCPGVARCAGEMGFMCYREAGHDGAHHSAPASPAPQCLTCGATEDLSAVHVRAREGIAARTEWYCHDTTRCHRRRHPEAASLVAQHGTAGTS